MTTQRALRKTVLTVLLCCALPDRSAPAGPASDEARARAERAFLDGRYDDMDPAVGAGTTLADVEPLALRDLWWRPKSGYRPPPIDPADVSLPARRLRWLLDPAIQTATPYPRPVPGETDAYPLMTALVEERQRRETLGAHGLPQSHPLWDDPDAGRRLLWRWYLGRSYRGPQLDDFDASDQEAIIAQHERADAAVRRNRTLAVASVLGLLAVAFWTSWRLGRRVAQGPA